jgi:hypothetical protein
MNAEMPFLLTGAVVLVGGTARDKGWPKEGLNAVIATGVLVILASLTNGTDFAPVVRAIGLLALLAAIMVSVPYIHAVGKKK